MEKKVAIVCYSFPPFPGVGGRRWAKFAKYLAKDGYLVYAIGAENVYSESSAWTQDTNHPRIKYFPLPLNFPITFIKGVKSTGDKILYRLTLPMLSLFQAGSIYEKTAFWKNRLLNILENLVVKEQVNNIIVSVPPYRIAYFSSLLKIKYPHVNLIIDYRDPWTVNNPFHGFTKIRKERILKEQYFELKTLDVADYILCVSDELSKDIAKICSHTNRIIVIPNGYDVSDLLPFKKLTQSTNPELLFVYAGTLYANLNHVIEPLINYISLLKKKNISLFNKLNFQFYGNHNINISKKIIESTDLPISVVPQLPLNEMHKKIENASFCLLIPPPGYPVVFNTKFYEYLANRKPILLFSYPCPAANFILKNKLGYIINPDSFNKDMDYFFANIDSLIKEFNYTFNINPYAVSSLTKELEKYIR